MSGQDNSQFQELKEVTVVRRATREKTAAEYTGVRTDNGPGRIERAKQETSDRAGRWKWRESRWWKAAIWVFGVLFGTVVITTAYAGFVYYKWTELEGQVSFSNIVEASVEDQTVPLDTAFQQSKVFLLLGMDTRKETGSLNTDVIMVAVVNPQSKKVTVVSIPRDTLLFPGEHRWKANGYYSNYFVDDRASAPLKVKEAFSRYLDIEIDYLTMINFKAFEQIIDDLGGLQINVDQDMRYTDRADGTDIDLKAGIQLLDGKKTLDFVRYRKSNHGTEPSNDIERNERQSQVISVMLDQLKSLNGVLNLGNIIDAIRENTSTDIPSGQLLPLVKEYLGVRKENIQFIHLNGTWKSPYIHVSDEELKNAQDALKANR